MNLSQNLNKDPIKSSLLIEKSWSIYPKAEKVGR
jgi:hypothetical protein